VDESDDPNIVALDDEHNRIGKPPNQRPTSSLVESVARIREGRRSDALEISSIVLRNSSPRPAR
jgi:hypothetical protein